MDINGRVSLEDEWMSDEFPGTLTRHLESRKAFVLTPWQPPPEVIVEDRKTAAEFHGEKVVKA